YLVDYNNQLLYSCISNLCIN
uniref:Uncharacterized protein n=1 Tax=Amphimedon queenslandica TaxID=400682 RepID=A0A1X7T8J1_AMPQE